MSVLLYDPDNWLVSATRSLGSYVAGTEELQEAMQHILNFDVGVWASAQSGGGTTRMEVVQALHNIFGPAKSRQDVEAATDGIVVVSFNGGRFVLDRINDLPVWRAMDMTLELHVFSRHIPATPDVAIDSFNQGEHLSVTVTDGTTQPVETP
jgi:hypothetical protein